MSVPDGLLSLDGALRTELLARFARRPWPPPPASGDDELLARTARRILQDLADAPPAGFPDCADWILIVPDASASFLRSEPIDPRLLVAGRTPWAELEDARRDAAASSAALLTLEIAGGGPASWGLLLPEGAPSPVELIATLGPDAPAVSARLSAPGFGELVLLHVFTLSEGSARHVPELSGVLSIRPPK